MRPLIIKENVGEIEGLKFSTNKILFIQDKKDLLKRIIHSIVGGALGFGISYKILNDISEINLGIKVISLVFIFITFLGLLFLSIYDEEFFEIPTSVSIAVALLLIILNIIIFFSLHSDLQLWSGNIFDPGLNLLTGILAAGFIFTIVLLTKGKGMGEGDIGIAGIMGLLLGFDKIVAGFYITIISASLIGILYSIKLGKFKGVQIPFVPFIAFGTIMAFFFASDLAKLFFSFYRV